MTCPVDGEQFSGWRAGSYSTYGARPDGKPFSYMAFPFPLPECPANRLVVFADFTPEEVKALATLIATPDYARIVMAETPYYRAFWLSRRLNRPAASSLRLLLHAIWEVSPGSIGAEDTPTKREHMVRYQREFVTGVVALPASTPAEDRLWLTIRAANALRQMGEFPEAHSLLATARSLADHDTEAAKVNHYIDRLDRTIAREDADVEPIDLLPPREAQSRCVSNGQFLATPQRALCRDIPRDTP